MASTFYGYSGFYGEHCLRSSLEYIYARYLDYMNIGWKYEHKIYILSNEVGYKPDFLLENGEFVEIKGVFNIVVGKPCSRKDVLYYLRSYVQNVRGTNANNEALELGDKKPLG